MGQFVAAVLAGFIPLVPALLFFLRQHHHSPARAMRRLKMGLMGFNIVVGLFAMGIGVVWLITAPSASAAGFDPQAAATSDPYASLAAAISTGLATIGSGIAVSATGSAAVGTIAEKPDTFGRALIFVGLAEGIAIYGLIISFMILNR